MMLMERWAQVEQYVTELEAELRETSLVETAAETATADPDVPTRVWWAPYQGGDWRIGVTFACESPWDGSKRTVWCPLVDAPMRVALHAINRGWVRLLCALVRDNAQGCCAMLPDARRRLIELVADAKVQAADEVQA